LSAGARSVLGVNGIVVATLAIGFLNSVVIAALFGLTSRVDAYYAALLLPSLFLALGVDYLGKNFLPTLVKARRAGGDTAAELTSAIVTIVALGAAAAALALALAAKPLFRAILPGFGADEIELVSRFFRIMAPALVFSAVTPFHEYVMQQDERYAHVMLIRALLPVASLAAIVGLGPALGEYALPIGYTTGQALAFALMWRAARYRYRPRLAVRAEWERKVLTSSAIVAGSGLTVRLRLLVANYLASLLGDGAIAALNFTRRLIEPLERTTFTGVKMLLFNKAAQLAARDDVGGVGALYRLAFAASFMLLAPVLWWLALESGAIVGALFERGAFGPEMTAVVAATLVGFAPSVAFLGVNGLMSHAFYALDRVAAPAVAMPIGTAVYLALAPFVYRPFGVPGLAFAASAAALAACAFLAWRLSRRTSEFPVSTALGKLLWYAAVAGGAFALARAALAGIDSPTLRAAAVLAAGMPLYFGVLALGRDRTLAELLVRVRGGRAPAAAALTRPAR